MYCVITMGFFILLFSTINIKKKFFFKSEILHFLEWSSINFGASLPKLTWSWWKDTPIVLFWPRIQNPYLFCPNNFQDCLIKDYHMRQYHANIVGGVLSLIQTAHAFGMSFSMCMAEYCCDETTPFVLKAKIVFLHRVLT